MINSNTKSMFVHIKKRQTLNAVFTSLPLHQLSSDTQTEVRGSLRKVPTVWSTVKRPCEPQLMEILPDDFIANQIPHESSHPKTIT